MILVLLEYLGPGPARVDMKTKQADRKSDAPSIGGHSEADRCSLSSAPVHGVKELNG